MTTKEIIDYIRSEQAVNLEELGYLELLAPDALQERGYCLLDLSLYKQTQSGKFSEVIFNVNKNFSKLRPGDDILAFNVNNLKHRGTVLENHVNEIIIRFNSWKKLDADTKWNIRLNEFFPNDNVIGALNRLVRGYPGWTHFSLIGGEKGIKELPRENITIPNAFIKQFNLAGPLIDIINESLKRRPIYAIQGPPGTGKTNILAVTAEIFSESNLRVAVMAPTHQAVNNALNKIKKFFPEREVIKIGDELRSDSINEDIETYGFREFNDLYGRRKRNEPEPIIGLTYYSGLYNIVNKINSFCPNVLLIDEAGQLTLSLGSIVGMFGAGSVILYGDDMQMPPIVSSDLKSHPLSISLFSAVKNCSRDIWSRLETTYRLNQELCDLIGTMFYADNNSHKSFLKSDPKAKDNTLQLDKIDDAEPRIKRIFGSKQSLFWIESNGSYCKQLNKVEADGVVEIVNFCLKNGKTKDDIAVVTPFRKQAAEIRRKLLTNHSSADIPIVDTVERVQGLTVEIIILSMVASDPDYIMSAGEFLFSINRLNVALSRATSKAIIFCSDEMLNSKPHTLEAFIGMNILNRIKKRANVIT
jgi:hypothetical protein